MKKRNHVLRALGISLVEYVSFCLGQSLAVLPQHPQSPIALIHVRALLERDHSTDHGCHSVAHSKPHPNIQKTA